MKAADRDWDRLILEALHASRPAYDEPPDWHAVLALYEGLGPAAAGELDRALVAMIDEEYRNPHRSAESFPFDDVMVNLPAGMLPDDLLCVEAAVLVAAERSLGGALFALNRLLRAPRWHAMYPRLIWLGQESFTAQRRLAATSAGRLLGALLGMALAEGLRLAAGGLAAGAWGEGTEAALALAAREPGRGLGAVLPPGYAQPLQRLVAEGPTAAAAPPAEAAGLILALGAASLEECLAAAVNLPPMDRLGCGAVAGARFGPLAAPRRWSTALRSRDRLEMAAEALYQAEFSPY